MFDEKKWLIKEVDKSLAVKIAQDTNVSELTARLLLARKMTDTGQIKEFLYGKTFPFYQPNLLKDMDISTERILLAIENKEKITIYGDYDVDGITSISLLHSFFDQINYHVDYYIPQRQSEGYGLNSASINQIFENGTTLIITVDCGISGVNEVENAPDGLDIIITDHHNPPEVLPKAYAIINPKQIDCNYPFKHLAGVGVAFKLCQGLWQKLYKTEEFWQNDMDLVALGTVADVVSLTDENREIVKLGLQKMQKTKNIGLNELMKTARVQVNRLTTATVGFMIAPRLNAAGRLDDAQLAVKLLTTRDKNKASELADFLEQENARRQQIEKEILAQAQEVMAKQGGVKKVLVLAAENWHIGVIGIVASRLVDKYNVPVIMISIADGVGKGSCRSIDAFDMYGALNNLKDYLLKYGGHHQAAGFSINQENIEAFSDAIVNYAKENLQEDDYIPVQNIDLQIDDFSKLDFNFLEQLQAFAPHGMGNPVPIISVADVVVKKIMTIGIQKEHLKISISKNDCAFDALLWRKAIYRHFLYNDLKIDLTFIPQINYWQEQKQINLHALNVKTKTALYDFRGESNEELNKVLAEIINFGKKLHVYSKDKSFFAQNDNIVLIDNMTTKMEYLVFWDAPHELFLKEFLPVQDNFAILKKVFLLYNKNSVAKQLQTVLQDFVDSDKLRCLYKDIMQNRLNSYSLLSKHYSEKFLHNALTVLQQIGAIAVDKDEIYLIDLPKGTKLDLEKSALYNEFLSKQECITKAFDKSLLLSREEFLDVLTMGASNV